MLLLWLLLKHSVNISITATITTLVFPGKFPVKINITKTLGSSPAKESLNIKKHCIHCVCVCVCVCVCNIINIFPEKLFPQNKIWERLLQITVTLIILFKAKLWCVYLEDILGGQRELRLCGVCWPLFSIMWKDGIVNRDSGIAADSKAGV